MERPGHSSRVSCERGVGTQGVVGAAALPSASASAGYVTPDGATQDRVAFLVNNLAADSLSAAAAELAQLVPAVNFMWFAKYLVRERVSAEVNLQVREWFAAALTLACSPRLCHRHAAAAGSK